jgi:2-oxoglutarate dehydrogenase E1 component
LILMTPKSLLRHKRAVSRLDELASGTSFHRVLWDDAQPTPPPQATPTLPSAASGGGLGRGSAGEARDGVIKLVSDDKIRRVVLCSGKVYYDLYEEREKRGIDDIYLLRIEQLYPFPSKALVTELSRFKQAEIVWCQEEPRNMGAWHFVEHYLEWVLNQIQAKQRRPRYATRPASAATAVGQMSKHLAQLKQLMDDALR